MTLYIKLLILYNSKIFAKKYFLFYLYFKLLETLKPDVLIQNVPELTLRYRTHNPKRLNHSKER